MALPEPPSEPAALAELVDEQVILVRLHWEPEPLAPRFVKELRARFQPTDLALPFPLYGNRSFPGAVAECFCTGHRTVTLIGDEQGDRQASVIVSRAPLQLICLDDPHCRRQLDPALDGQICVVPDYETTGRWADALRRWYPTLQGIRYTARHAGDPHLNYALFLDRIPVDALVRVALGRLRDLKALTLQAADQYNLAVTISWHT